MATELIRSVTLQRLASPEHLNEILRLSRPPDWAPLAALSLLLGAVAAWAWLGSITIASKARGVLILSGGMISITAPSYGQVVEWGVVRGDHVRAGQRIGRIGQPNLAEQFRLKKQELTEAQYDAQRSTASQAQTTRFQIAALKHQKANAQNEIAQLKNQQKFAKEVVSQQEQLVSYGLATRHPWVAAQERLAGIDTQIAQLEGRLTQLEAEQAVAEETVVQNETRERAHLAEISRALSGLKQQLQTTTYIVSPADGQVVELQTYVGATVAAGSPVLSIQSDSGVLQALLYVASDEAKAIKPGMSVQLAPTNIRREKHGFLVASVLSVGDFPISHAAMVRKFENDTLAAELTAHGPVTELRVALSRSNFSPSGFQWSSGNGPKIHLTSGTLCEGRIVTEREKPLRLVLPMLRKEFGAS